MIRSTEGQKKKRRPRVLQGPPQGWLSLALFLGMLAVVGISIADRRPLLIGPEALEADRTGSLIVVMLAAGLIGFLLARSSMGIVRAHVIGAAVGATVLLMVVGAAAQGDSEPLLRHLADLEPRITVLGDMLRTDLNESQLGPTVPVTATLMVLGAIAWATGQFGAFSLYRYDRAGPAVMTTGVLLFLNMAMSPLDGNVGVLPVIPVLAVYSVLAMLLLIRMQLSQQGVHWTRRQIANTGEVGRLFLRSGVFFVAIVVVGASSLTAMATVRPPSVDLDDLGAPLAELGEQLSRLLPIVGLKPSDAALESLDSFEIQEEWFDSDGTAFTVEPDTSLYGNYWWGEAFDEFDGWTWRQTDRSEAEIESGESLKVSGDGSPFGTFPVEVTVTPQEGYLVDRGTVLGPTDAMAVDREVVLRDIDGDKGRASISLALQTDRQQPYTVRSRVQDYEGSSGGLSASDLRSAGVDYPQWVRERYLQVHKDATGQLTTDKAAEIEARADNPYDRALLLQNQLQQFDYEITFKCDSRNVSECLLDVQVGFCQQFASTMIMVLREMKIPARLVNGYLPGGIVDGVWDVPRRAAHSWVEVYFPAYGWIRFDPTPVDNAEALNQTVTGFPDPVETPGPVPSGPPEPVAEPSAFPTFEPFPTFGPAVIGPGGDGGSGFGESVITMGVAVMLGLVVIFGLLFYRLRRLPGPDAGLAYRGIVSLASRLGYGPHPSQTEYEYAAALSETLPTVRDDLYLVADSRVEATYGQGPARVDRIPAVRRAYARIRTALLRLSLRRKR